MDMLPSKSFRARASEREDGEVKMIKSHCYNYLAGGCSG